MFTLEEAIEPNILMLPTFRRPKKLLTILCTVETNLFLTLLKKPSLQFEITFLSINFGKDFLSFDENNRKHTDTFSVETILLLFH